MNAIASQEELLTEISLLELHMCRNLGGGNIFANSLVQENPGDNVCIDQAASLVLLFSLQ